MHRSMARRLWYEVRGEGEPLLLHHGYTASRVNWMPVAERLEAHYQIILMECRGTGQSEHTPDGYTLEQYAADVVGMLDHLGLDKVSFAGHSMSGGIGFLLALEHRDRLRRLILMAPIPAEGVGEITPELREQRMAERRRGDRGCDPGALSRHCSSAKTWRRKSGSSIGPSTSSPFPMGTSNGVPSRCVILMWHIACPRSPHPH